MGHEYVTAKIVCPIPQFYLISERFRGEDNKDECTTSTQELVAEAQDKRERFTRREVLQVSSEVMRTSSDSPPLRP